MQTRQPTAFIILTLIAFAFPIYTQILLALIAGSNTHEDSTQMLLRHFPQSLTIKTINYLTIGLSVLTAVFAELWRRRDNHLGKTIAFLILIAAVLITIFTFFKVI